jgi:hypothetical protein
VKETINNMERQNMEWERIFANHIPNKGLISKIYEELRKLSFTKAQKNSTDIFPKDIPRGQQVSIKVFNLSNPWRNQIKTTMRCHLIGYYQKAKRQQVLMRKWEKRKPSHNIVEKVN